LTPTVTVLALYSTPFVTLFYGPSFSPAGLSLSVLAIGGWFLTFFYILTSILNGAGHVKQMMWFCFFGFLLNTLLSILTTISFGIIGAALSTTVTSVFLFFGVFFFVNKIFQPDGVLVIVGKTLVSLLVALTSWFLLRDLHLYFVLEALIVSFVFLVPIGLFGELRPSRWHLAR
ncbi:MAG: polysaccharide biosynthesis C-terminal domain-containing protein, partial [Candidatus Moranbacteria bacterium]|nr:polysaccharide biosynthesis C-terminal domain-containing protein [Candidatus Moranbacteria bacterium]